MFVSLEMMACKYSVSISTIRRVMYEMERTGRYEGAIKRIGRTEIDTEAFEHYACRRKRRVKNGAT